MIAPLATLPVPGLRNSRAGLFGATTLALTGFAANRMNTAVTGLEAWPHTTCFPSWQEIAPGARTAAFVCLSRFPAIVPRTEPGRDAEVETRDGVPGPMMAAGRRGLVLVASIGTALFLVGAFLVKSFADAKRRAAATPQPGWSASTGGDDLSRFPIARTSRGPKIEKLHVVNDLGSHVLRPE